MRFRLADSLTHVAERSRGILSFDDRALSRLVARLRGDYRFPPVTFALYYDLVDAIQADRLADAEAIFGEICRQGPILDTLTITNLDPAVLGATEVDRYCRMMDTDLITRFRYTTPPRDVVRNFSGQCENAITLMARATPELYGEFSALVCEIILATGQSSDGRGFAGASSFLLWGALFINPRADQLPVSLIQTFAHESAHSLLFGLMIDDSFVLNPDEERFQSPLRSDPRPMDGIYHATFVVARMHYAMERLLASGLLNAANTEVAKAALHGHRQAFADGLATIGQHGRLTTHGAAIMSSAAGYMARAA
jgi:HEXXH motif-containing protein